MGLSAGKGRSQFVLCTWIRMRFGMGQTYCRLRGACSTQGSDLRSICLYLLRWRLRCSGGCSGRCLSNRLRSTARCAWRSLSDRLRSGALVPVDWGLRLRGVVGRRVPSRSGLLLLLVLQGLRVLLRCLILGGPRLYWWLSATRWLDG